MKTEEEILKKILEQEIEGFEEETENLPSIVLPEVTSNPENRKLDKNDDYSIARESIRNQLAMMDQASRRALQNALSCDQPRMMEVFSQLMTTMTVTAEKLLKIQKQMNELDGINPAQAATIHAENVFYGSTNDLLEDRGGSDDSKVIDGIIVND